MSAVRNKPQALSVETRAVFVKSPWDCLMELRGEIAGRPVVVWEGPDGTELAGVGEACRIEASGPGRFEEVRARLDSVLGRGGRAIAAVGGFSFGEQGEHGGWPGFPDALFLVPERLFCRRLFQDTFETRCAPLPEESDPPRRPAEPASPNGWGEAAWIDATRRTLDRIQEGALSKVVLARSMVIPVGDAACGLDILEALRATYPTCYRFLIDDGRGRAFLGASPERLVRLEAKQFHTEAVAGTQRCGEEDDQDAMARELLERVKDQREHEVVLRHILDTLTPMSIGKVRSKSAEVMRLPHLLHLRTRIQGWARASHVLDYVARLHPTPAIAGWPRERALEWIRRVEPEDRGWYAGCVGWVDGFHEGDFAVGIRSIAMRDGMARVFAGAGIVEGSDPKQEWNETELKMKGILDAIARD